MTLRPDCLPIEEVKLLYKTKCDERNYSYCEWYYDLVLKHGDKEEAEKFWIKFQEQLGGFCATQDGSACGEAWRILSNKRAGTHLSKLSKEVLLKELHYLNQACQHGSPMRKRYYCKMFQDIKKAASKFHRLD